MNADDSADFELIDRLAEEFAERQRRGEGPTVEEYTARHPDIADEIREIFPALAMVERAVAKQPLFSTDSLKQIGDFRLIREIGRGGMGVVFEAEQISLRRRVALKILPPIVAANPRTFERFQREARSAAAMHHTNIVPVHEVGMADGIAYFAMQFIEGRSLDVLIRRWQTERPLDRCEHFRKIATWIQQAADALAYAHSRKTIHRDIKPSNLILDESGVLWIADFGLAKGEDDDLTNTGELVGTLRYMAPERLRGECDTRADVYSLGLTLYELLTLEPAFGNSDRGELLHRIQTSDPKPPRTLEPSIPRDLETVVLKAMEKTPSRRYASAALFADDLRRFLADEPLAARRPGNVEQAIRFCRRRPAVALLLFFGMLTAVASTVAAFTFRRETRRATKAETAARLREADAYLTEANAISQSRRPGQRFQALDAIAKAVAIGREIGRPASWFDRARTEATSALALTDIAPLISAPADSESGARYAISPDGKCFARSELGGKCTIVRRDTGEEIVELANSAADPTVMFLTNTELLRGFEARPPYWEIWKFDTAERSSKLLLTGKDHCLGLDIRADGRVAAIVNTLGDIDVVALPEGNLITRLPRHVLGRDVHVSIHPTRPWLATSSYYDDRAFVRDYLSGTTIAEMIPARDSPGAINLTAGSCWSPDGTALIVAVETGPLEYRVAPDGKGLRIVRVIPRRSGGTLPTFNPTGDRLACSLWAGGLDVVDLSGNVLFNATIPYSYRPRWEHRDFLTVIPPRQSGQTLAYRVADGREVRRFGELHPPMREHFSGTRPAIHPSGKFLVTAGSDRLRVFDLRYECEVARLDAGRFSFVEFSADGTLFAKGGSGIWKWQVHIDSAHPERITFGPPELSRLPGAIEGFSVAASGSAVASGLYNGYGEGHVAGVWVTSPQRLRPAYLPLGLVSGSYVLAPDGKYLVAARAGKILIVDLATLTIDGESRQPLSPMPCFFAHNGMLIGNALAGENSQGLTFDANFRPVQTLGIGQVCDVGSDARTALLNTAEGELRLVDFDTGRELVSARQPECPYPTGRFTIDGAGLIFETPEGVKLWDLRALRQRLSEMGLDWNAPAYPTKTPDTVPRLEVSFVGGERIEPMQRARHRFWRDVSEPFRQPWNAEAYAVAAAACSLERLHQTAVNIYRIAIGLDPNNWEFRREYALAVGAAGDWTRASILLSAMLRDEPSNLVLRESAVAVAMQRGDWNGVVALANADGPNESRAKVKNAMLVDVSAIAFDRLGRKEAARAARQRAESSVSDIVGPERIWAWAHLVYGDARLPPAYSLALAESIALRNRASTHSELTRGLALYRLGRFPEALKVLDSPRYLQEPDSAVHVGYVLAMCLHRLGKPSARRQLLEARQLRLHSKKLDVVGYQQALDLEAEAESILASRPGE